MEQDKQLKINLAKDFPVRADRLYQAWIDPEQLKQWWHPMGNVLQQATTEPKEGEPVTYTFANEQGAHSFTIKGTYKEVAAGKKLVYTWNWELPVATVGNSAFLLTVVFSENAGGSRLEVIQENFIEEEAVQPHREGWENALNSLHNFLSGQTR